MGIFLGIDGGGSKTSCLIGDQRSVLGRGDSGPSNILRVGKGQASEALGEAIRQACKAANINPHDISRTCVGIAGAGRSEIAELVRRTISKIVSGDIEVTGDMEIALHAAFGRGAGIIVVAGTGSIAYGRNASGETARAGGWGHAISDEGSGHWIGRETLAALFCAWDQDEHGADSLLNTIMDAWSVRTKDQLVLAANGSPPRDFAALFPAVLAAADAQNELAMTILIRAGKELARLAKIVIERLFMDAERIPVAMSGGVFANAALVREVFYNELSSAHAQVVVDEKIIDPVLGTLDRARNPG